MDSLALGHCQRAFVRDLAPTLIGSPEESGPRQAAPRTYHYNGKQATPQPRPPPGRFGEHVAERPCPRPMRERRAELLSEFCIGDRVAGTATSMSRPRIWSL